MLNAVDAAERGARILTRTKVVAGDQAYIFQGDDSRVIFAIPYEQDFTLIGTTEAPHESMQDPATMSGAERAYLIDFVNRYLRGDIDKADFDRFAAEMRTRYAWLDTHTLHRMLRAYGTRIETVLGTASCIEELGGHFACGLHVAEVDYMLSHEFAQTAEDILWRRSKLGLRFNSNEAADLVRWLGGDEVEAIQRPARMKH